MGGGVKMRLNELEDMMVDILTPKQKEKILKAAKAVEIKQSEQLGAIATACRLNKISRSTGSDFCFYEAWSNTVKRD